MQPGVGAPTVFFARYGAAGLRDDASSYAGRRHPEPAAGQACDVAAVAPNSGVFFPEDAERRCFVALEPFARCFRFPYAVLPASNLAYSVAAVRLKYTYEKKL